MSAPAVEPGSKLADRFRLEDRVAESGGATMWKAIDEVLARPVAVQTFDADFPRMHEVVTAARAASRLSDPRLTQVFDAAEEEDHCYVVSEWVTGESLTDMLAAGPLDPERAAALVAEAAEAIAHAHEAGLSHLRLRPDRLIWTEGGTVKVLGLAVDAALEDATSDDMAREDAEGLGRLLYAGLTGHWPGYEDETDLPPAPLSDGHFCSPRQVTAGVPGYLDTITCRIVLPDLRRNQPPLTTPLEVAEALSAVPRPAPVPISAIPPAVVAHPSGPPTSPHRAYQQQQTYQPVGYKTTMMSAPPQRQGNVVNRALATVVVLLVIVAVGVGAWTLGRNLSAGPDPTDNKASGTPTPEKEVKPVAIKPEKANQFDPLGDDGDENQDLAHFAIDGKPSTEWHTQNYNSHELGRLKDGVGLILDMGKSVSIYDVHATLAKAPGATLELKVGDSPELKSLKVVAKQKDASGKVTLKPDKPVNGRYVLLWFTRVPMDQGYRGTIYEVVVNSPGPA
ncbi:protein kinase family protein [Sinosporangium siamense]|uniref:non-specific serine/threonine protein kinase n=1 Tax=Sinosporangium siamense TaxID=1367973 RepID=A0A919RNS1_9ACTN|nr:protein kinase family protein [Sinosporangium siamense]GII97162.1 serine/threonine protein kinase [Sinosporangium siamense]